jgi:hypothetical protein
VSLLSALRSFLLALISPTIGLTDLQRQSAIYASQIIVGVSPYHAEQQIEP